MTQWRYLTTKIAETEKSKQAKRRLVKLGGGRLWRVRLGACAPSEGEREGKAWSLAF